MYGQIQSSGSGYLLLAILGSIILIPHAMFVSLELSSLGLGMVLVVVLFLLINGNVVLQLRFQYVILIILVVFVYIIVVFAMYAYVTTESYKPIFSLAWLLFLMMSFQLKQLFVKLSFKKLFKAFNFLGLFCLMLGWMSVFFDPMFLNYSNHEKPVFPFSEESHFALAVGMVSIGVISVASVRLALFYIVNLTALSLTFPNLTLLVFSTLAVSVLVLRIRPQFLLPMLTIGAVSTVVVLYYIVSSIDYFSSRLSLSDSTNLTTLVWVQGWELAFLNFVKSNGLGLGFQSLGLSTTNIPEISNHVLKISGKINNLEDGGFLASKLIAEFGLIGFVVSFYFLIWVFRYLFVTNSLYAAMRFGVSVSCDGIIKKRILLSSLLFAFLVEFFLRGYGYFSPGLVVVVAVIMYLVNQENKRYLYECTDIK